MGSVNLSIILSRRKGNDIRNMGSGNAGATNTLRTYGKGMAAAVLLWDILKAVLPVLFVGGVLHLGLGAALTGLGAILGHNFPLYFGFRGGKGVATSLGAVLAMNWRVALLALLVFLLVLLLSKYVSLSSCMAAISLLPLSYIFERSIWYFLIYAFIGVLIVVRHHQNIGRLFAGTESKLGAPKEEKS